MLAVLPQMVAKPAAALQTQTAAAAHQMMAPAAAHQTRTVESVTMLAAQLQTVAPAAVPQIRMAVSATMQAAAVPMAVFPATQQAASFLMTHPVTAKPRTSAAPVPESLTPEFLPLTTLAAVLYEGQH